MVRDINLLSYLPEFLQEYREIKQIMTSANPEVQELKDHLEEVKDNQFITTCNLNGIKRYEQLLKIIPNEYDNLEARISRVITRWNDSTPYTLRALASKLDLLCGEGNYKLLPHFDNYLLHLIVSLPLSGQVEELEYLLSYMIPANIMVHVDNLISRDSDGKVFIGGSFVVKKEITQNMLHLERSVGANIFIGGNTITKKEINQCKI